MRRIQKRSECPVSYALDLFGDRWTLLIMRDIVFRGFRFYKEFLEGGEGIATNVLSDRLKMLESRGFLESKKYEPQKTKKLYILTEDGIALIPMLLEILLWGITHDPSLQIQPGIAERIKNDREALIAEIIVSLKSVDSKNFC